MLGIYEVIKSLAAYLIFVTLLLNLVNGNTYKKYVELVCGVILILIVLVPVAGFFTLDDNFNYEFDLSQFEIKMREEGVFKEAEEIKQKRLEKGYKELLENKIISIVEEEGRCVKKIHIILAEDNYGTIEEVEVEISRPYEQKGDVYAQSENWGILIEPVEINISEGEKVEESIMEKNKITEAIRNKIASEFAIKEERITVYQKG